MDYTSYDVIVKGRTLEDRKPIEPGYYPAVCYGVVVTGTHVNFNNESVTEVVILWELPFETFVYDGEENCKTMSATYRMSLTNSNLSKMLEGWRGKPFSEEELAGFALNKIITKPCGLTVVNKTSKTTGRTYPVINSVTPLAKGTAMPRTMYHEPLCFNICDDRFDRELIDELPEWLAKRVKDSSEYNMPKTASENFEITSNENDLPF